MHVMACRGQEVEVADGARAGQRGPGFQSKAIARLLARAGLFAETLRPDPATVCSRALQPFAVRRTHGARKQAPHGCLENGSWGTRVVYARCNANSSEPDRFRGQCKAVTKPVSGLNLS